VNRARLLLVDDHTILREGVRALLELEQDFEIVGDAGALSEAVEATRRLRPDLIRRTCRCRAAPGRRRSPR
jgi:DNA-binding NarL/FixJ family response regulator